MMVQHWGIADTRLLCHVRKLPVQLLQRRLPCLAHTPQCRLQILIMDVAIDLPSDTKETRGCSELRLTS